jgi:Zn ribbon nucleic-acid-binding protein
MKNSKKCPKCNSFDIIKSPASVWRGNDNQINAGFSRVPVIRYLCVQCGYSEEWVESKNDRMKLKKKWKNNSL